MLKWISLPLSFVVYSFVGIETRPNEIVAVPMDRAGRK
jgi:hypothetical protein